VVGATRLTCAVPRSGEAPRRKTMAMYEKPFYVEVIGDRWVGRASIAYRTLAEAKQIAAYFRKQGDAMVVKVWDCTNGPTGVLVD
jgi:hypothetical protein